MSDTAICRNDPTISRPGSMLEPASEAHGPATQPSELTAEQQSAADRPTGNRREKMLTVGSSLAFDVGLSMLIFNQARRMGATETQAYMLSMIGPLVGIAFEWFRHRRLGKSSIFVLTVQAVSALVAVVGSTSPDVLLLKDSALTGTVGLVVLVSLTPRFQPFTFAMGERFATDGTDAGVARWHRLWEISPDFRRLHRMCTLGWGIGLLLEALTRIVAVLTLSFDQAYNVGQVLPLILTAIMVTWTVSYARIVKARSRAVVGSPVLDR